MVVAHDSSFVQQAAKDYRADPDLYEQCKPDAQQLCANVEPGEGRVQSCLVRHMCTQRHASVHAHLSQRDHRSFLSWECQEELFRQEVENADDMRLSVRLLRKCMGDKKKYCADVPFGMLHSVLYPKNASPGFAGNARVYECLETHRNDEGFSPECKDEFEKMMERRAADFRLDFTLREMCKRDIDQLCSYEKESLDSVEGFDARVIICLQDFRDELSDEECRKSVHRVIQRAAEDIRFDEPLADACYQDRKQFCPNAHAVRSTCTGRHFSDLRCDSSGLGAGHPLPAGQPRKAVVRVPRDAFRPGGPHGRGHRLQVSAAPRLCGRDTKDVQGRVARPCARHPVPAGPRRLGRHERRVPSGGAGRPATGRPGLQAQLPTEKVVQRVRDCDAYVIAMRV